MNLRHANWLILCLLFSRVTFAATKGYRVIHASPQEFALALSTRLTRTPHKRAEVYASRLERFFRVQSKYIEGNTVTMGIMPDVPLLEPAFGGNRLLMVKTTLTKQTELSFFYDVEMSAGFTIFATMEVSPHPSGSLLTCAITKAPLALPETLIFKTLFALGFLAEKPAGADNL